MKYLAKINEYPIHWALGGNDLSGGLEQNAVELSLFLEWMEENEVKTILEIGMAKGLLSKLLTELGYHVEGITDNVDMLQFIPRKLYTGKSQEISGKVGEYDLVFVDGDHSYEAVKEDFKLYSKKAKFIAFHDTHNYPRLDTRGVFDFWRETKNKYEYKEFVDWKHPEQAGGIGVLIKKK